MQSTIRLFKALPIEKKAKKTDDDLARLTIPKGFIFAPEVIANYPDTSQIVKLVEEAYGLSPDQLNQSFHKSWGKIKDAPIQQLLIEQLVHYFTTYGFEGLGIYSPDSVYIPREELDVPELKEGVNIVVIRGFTKPELKKRLMNFLATGIALGQDTIEDVLDVATFVGIRKADVEKVKNKEVKIALYDYLDMVPADPIEFLRYVVYKATNTTLLIKNAQLIEQIKSRNNTDVSGKFAKFEKDFGLESLAVIFYRFKPIFLAFRTNKNLKRAINRVRRLAESHHQPMPESFLDSVTGKLGRGDKITLVSLRKELDRVNIFRKIRLAYALKFRTKDVDSILYRIRNGRAFAKDFEFANKQEAQRLLDVVTDSIVKEIAPNVKGKKIYIPEYIDYALPATEKQFTGDFPSGTSVKVSEDMIAGVHWKDVGSHRIDLDLSVISPESGKIGWDSDYRTPDRGIMFSGDMTEAHSAKGSSELFYISQEAKGTLIVWLNYYNYDADTPVPFKILVAKEKPARFGENYMVDPNNVIAVTTSIAKERQKSLGIIVVDDEESRFYFAETNLGNTITSGNQEYAEQARRFLTDFYTDTLSLNQILVDAGAKLVEDRDEADIDLSPEQISKDTIIGLLKPSE